MENTQQLNIVLPNELAEAIKLIVQCGDYANESEVILDSLQIFLSHDQCIEGWLGGEGATARYSSKFELSRSFTAHLMRLRLSLEYRKKIALSRADQVLSYFKDVGVSARLFGSVTGDRFSITSDVDFLILSCPDNLRYRIESRVEDIMGSIPFDVVYYDSLSENFKSNLDLC